jgi:hypothetical protein
MSTGFRRGSVLLLLLATLACSRHAMLEPKAWIQKSLSSVLIFPIRCKYTMTDKWVLDGVPTVLQLSGVTIVADQHRSRTNLRGVAYAVANPKATARVKLVTIFDGTYLWIEATVGTAELPVISRAPQRPTDQYLGVVGLVAKLMQEYEFARVGYAGGRILLDGDHPKAHYPVRVELDPTTARPLEIWEGTDPVSIHVAFHQWETAVTIDSSPFVYSPPDGATVRAASGDFPIKSQLEALLPGVVPGWNRFGQAN